MLVGCCEDGAATIFSYGCVSRGCCVVRAGFASPQIVGADVPGVMLKFTEDGKSAFVGSRPGMVEAGCALLQACCWGPTASDAGGGGMREIAAERSESLEEPWRYS